MANPFDNLRKSMLRTVKGVYKHDATWTPSAGGAAVVAKVLFNEPNNERKQLSGEYYPEIYTMEYFEQDFVGLYESNRSGTPEWVEVNGQRYEVQEVKKFWDGQTYRAQLQKV